jgi:hypothetical protein
MVVKYIRYQKKKICINFFCFSFASRCIWVVISIDGVLFTQCMIVNFFPSQLQKPKANSPKNPQTPPQKKIPRRQQINKQPYFPSLATANPSSSGEMEAPCAFPEQEDPGKAGLQTNLRRHSTPSAYIQLRLPPCSRSALGWEGNPVRGIEAIIVTTVAVRNSAPAVWRHPNGVQFTNPGQVIRLLIEVCI